MHCVFVSQKYYYRKKVDNIRVKFGTKTTHLGDFTTEFIGHKLVACQAFVTDLLVFYQ